MIEAAIEGPFLGLYGEPRVNVLLTNIALDEAFPMPPAGGEGYSHRMTPDAEIRPSPDALLTQAAREGRGRLKVFLGAAPGVGKTWAMLDDAHRKRAEGRRCGGRPDRNAWPGRNAGQAGGPAAACRASRCIYKGRALTEMDLDGLLARKPALALIDELAHTNADGSRHEKRWQDVEEVLAAGIDVYTTLNIQHIETLNETVARITGVRVRETVPGRRAGNGG